MRKHSITYLFIGQLLLLCFSACRTEDSHLTITGTVRNNSGTAIINAMVSTNNATTFTDNMGQYQITAEKEGQLSFEAENYISTTVAINQRTTIDVTLENSPWLTSFNSNNNSIKDPQFPSNSLIPSILLPAPSATDSWFTAAPYTGAIAIAFGNTWYSNWSFFDRIIGGNLPSAPLNIASKPRLIVNDAWMRNQGNTINWSADTIYILDSLVFVEAGQTLQIAAGTVVQAQAGSTSGTAALIIAKGAKIMALGTTTAPIIFTYKGDLGNTPATKQAEWGGLVILGKAQLNSSLMEIPFSGIAANDNRGYYGGNDDADNSGILQYVSIRHAGKTLGLNSSMSGLSLGAVGSNTTLDHVEVVASAGHGIQWLGGTVNAKHLIAASNGKNALNCQEGYSGKNQFVIVYQGANQGNFGSKHNGTTNTNPQFWNVTSIGNANSQAVLFADNAGGAYYNSIFSNYGKGISIEDKKRSTQDSYQQFLDGKLTIANSIFHNIGTNNTNSNIFFINYTN